MWRNKENHIFHMVSYAFLMISYDVLWFLMVSYEIYGVSIGSYRPIVSFLVCLLLGRGPKAWQQEKVQKVWGSTASISPPTMWNPGPKRGLIGCKIRQIFCVLRCFFLAFYICLSLFGDFNYSIWLITVPDIFQYFLDHFWHFQNVHQIWALTLLIYHKNTSKNTRNISKHS